eukprot:scaffold26128_cov71-Phaeocystis_antarctica.AAC.2
MAVWPLASANCRAVLPSSSSSLVLAWARSSTCTHGTCAWRAANIRAVRPRMLCRSGLAESCRRRLRMERWPLDAACMSAVRPHAFCRSTVAPRFSSSLTSSRWPLAAAACSRVLTASTSPPLRSHSTTFRSSPCQAELTISTGSSRGSEAVGIAAGSTATGGAAGEAAAGCGDAACCRRSSTMAVWPLSSAHCSAVWPPWSSSSVLALARSRACTHASGPKPAAIIRAVRPFSSRPSVFALARSRACTHASCPAVAASIRAVEPTLECRSGSAECCRRRFRVESWPRYAASMSAVVPVSLGKSTLAPRFSSSLTISRWPLAAAVCNRDAVVTRPSAVGTGQSASTLALPSRLVDLVGQRSGRPRALRELASVVLPDELRDGRVALQLSMLQGGVAASVEQLGVGLGSQQHLHDYRLPSVSSQHQGGAAEDVR